MGLEAICCPIKFNQSCYSTMFLLETMNPGINVDSWQIQPYQNIVSALIGKLTGQMELFSNFTGFISSSSSDKVSIGNVKKENGRAL